MIKELRKIAKQHGCTITDFEFVNNFDWKYYSLKVDDKEGQHLPEFDFEYCIYDEGYKEKNLQEFETFLATGKLWYERLQ